MNSKILSVTAASLQIEKTNPPRLVIQASGFTTTGGWSNGLLIPYVYITPPQDGIWDFDFVATRPTGFVTQMLTPIIAEDYIWEDFPAALKGVRIHGSSNYIEALLSPNTDHISAEEAGSFKKVSPAELAELKQNNDLFNITNAFVWENTLTVDVLYGGGCQKHDFILAWDGSTLESAPVQIPLCLIHDNNQDNCRALVRETLQFDLSEHLQHGVDLKLEGWADLISYA